MNRGKGGEVLEMQPGLFPHDGFVVLGGAVGGREGETVIGPRHHLRFALDDLLQLQLLAGTLVVLRDGVVSDLQHVRVVEVLDRSPTAGNNCVLRYGGGEEEGEKKKTHQFRHAACF
ncbi:hypothetical protein Fmac_013698 [Flemingia macrophylla]|uniref:Uncharacterized protein n=1 Tax=Flemingia macrophylla TaxID=520843 RepID=A0ABD1MTV7_9FABA